MMGLFQKRKQQKLLAQQHAQVAAELQPLVDRITDDEGVISPESFREFMQYVSDHEISTDLVPEVVRAVGIGLAQGGCFLAGETTLLLKKDEHALLDADAQLLKEVADRQFVGGSQGLSVPLGKGFRFRTSGFRGHSVTVGSHWEAADAGTLTVTDERVVYHGRRKTLEFPYSRLTAMTLYSDGSISGSQIARRPHSSRHRILSVSQLSYTGPTFAETKA